MPTLEGIVERIVFSSPDDAYSVIRLRPDGPGRPGAGDTAVGHLPGVQEGQRLRLQGDWVEDRRYGRQFRVETYSVAVPATVEGIERYLGSGLIPGVGPVIAKRIVDEFGERSLDVIRDSPEALLAVDGIGERRVEDIRLGWREQHGLQEAMVSLASFGITAGLAARIVRTYGDRAPHIVKSDPYRLADDVRGIGFKKADAIAAELGVARDSPRRAEAGVLYALGLAADDGHLYLVREALIERAQSILGIDSSIIESALESLAQKRRIVAEEGDDGCGIYLDRHFRAECDLAHALAQLATTPLRITEPEVALALDRSERGLSISLSDAQREAVKAVLEKRLVVLTGGPGTGKTTVTRAVCAALQFAGQRLALCAPTGRAAKRMGEATGLRASTVHRLLQFDPRLGGFQRGADNPLDTDVVLVDEASMLDLELALALVSAVPISARMVWIGDVDQLPPVGAGSVLLHLIESGLATTIRLDQIFRQGSESLIVSNAHRILHGELPQSGEPGGESDFYIVAGDEPALALERMRVMVLERIPAAFGFDPIEDVQILTPMHRGELGAANLNQQFQRWLNPDGRAWVRGQREYREGDKVMQVRNNYDKEVFNGDVGRIERVDARAQLVEVRFDDRTLKYEADELDELDLAYAVTVHKSQGSEYPAVVMPLHTQHYVMLRRNLLYTAVTRAKKLAVVVASASALRMAVDRHEEGGRASRLANRLRQEASC